MNITKADVIAMLENYKEWKRRAAQLEFEIQHYRPMATEADIIDMMMFGQTSDGIVSKGHISNKTVNIALSYDERKDELNIKELDALNCDLQTVMLQMARIRHYISLLETKQSDVLTQIYIHNTTLPETAERLNMSLSTVQRNRNNGVNKLCEMFGLVVSE